MNPPNKKRPKRRPRKPEELSKPGYFDQICRQALGQLTPAEQQEFSRLVAGIDETGKHLIVFAARAAQRADLGISLTAAEARGYLRKIGKLSAELGQLLKESPGQICSLQMEDHLRAKEELPILPGLMDVDGWREIDCNDAAVRNSLDLHQWIFQMSSNLEELSLAAYELSNETNPEGRPSEIRKPAYSTIGEFLVRATMSGQLPFQLKNSNSSELAKLFRLICRMAGLKAPDNAVYHLNQARERLGIQ